MILVIAAGGTHVLRGLKTENACHRKWYLGEEPELTPSDKILA